MSKIYRRKTEKDAQEFYETSKGIGYDVAPPVKTPSGEWEIIINDYEVPDNKSVETAREVPERDMQAELSRAEVETDTELEEVKRQIGNSESRQEEQEYIQKYKELQKIKKEISGLSRRSTGNSNVGGNLKGALKMLGIGGINRRALGLYRVNPAAGNSINTSKLYSMGNTNYLKSLTMPPNKNIIQRNSLKSLSMPGINLQKLKANSSPLNRIVSPIGAKSLKKRLNFGIVKPKRGKKGGNIRWI